MSGEPGDPRRTLEELEAARLRAEQELEERLTELRRRVERLQDQGRSAEELAEARPGRQPPAPTPPEPLSATGRDDDVDEGPAPGLRGLRGRIVSWLLGERLEAVERRDAMVRQEIARLRADLRDLAEGSEAGLRRLAQWQEELHGHLGEDGERAAEAVRMGRDLVEGGSAAVAALIEVQETLRTLLEVKDAESRARVLEGPGAKAELVLEEVRRQQEAILDDLVGRRDELEAMVDDLRERLSRDG